MKRGWLFLPLELLVDGIIGGWLYLMEWIVPERYISRTFRIILKVFVWIISALLLFVILVGVFAIISDDSYIKQLGMYMVFILLGISAVQILLGILFRIVSKKKK